MTLFRGDWFFIALVLIDSFFVVRPYIYAIQQDNYKIIKIFKSKHLGYLYAIDLIAISIFALIWALMYVFDARPVWGFALLLAFFVAEFALYFMEDLPNKKKPLKYTKRVVRTIIFNIIASTGLFCVVYWIINLYVYDFYIKYLAFVAFQLIFPLLFILFTIICNIFEALNNKRYENLTRRILSEQKDMTKIAITGSYGKTTVKNILLTLLSDTHNTVATPESYNTPMGISKTVSNLDISTEIFISEMGARHVGDIHKLMKLVRPNIGVLTGINSQHLETFKSLENIVKEKCKIVSELSVDGYSVINGKFLDQVKDVLGEQYSSRNIITAGLDQTFDVHIKDIQFDENGSKFLIFLGGEYYAGETLLIGFQNLEDIAIACAVAFSLGVKPQKIIDNLEKLKPVPHRMQLISANGLRIIDDTFNSNPDGARRTLEVLSLFEGRKVVATPGLVELGKLENDENYRLATEIADVADVVMLIGKKRTKIMLKALNDTGYDGEVFIYESLEKAENDFVNTLHLGDVLLLLNDLPDIYDD